MKTNPFLIAVALLLAAAPALAADPVNDAAATETITRLGVGGRYDDDAKTKLRSVNFEFAHERDVIAQAIPLLPKLPELEAIFFKGTGLTDAQLTGIKGLTRITMLDLTGTRITDAGLENLALMVNMDSLTLKETQLDGTGFKHFKGMTKLTFLDLRDAPITDAGLANLRGLPINNLLLTGTKVTDAGLPALAECKQLERLIASDNSFTGKGFAGNTNLKILRAGKYTSDIATFNDEGLQALAGCKLEELELGGKMTDAGLAVLKKMTGTMRDLALSSPGITGKGLADIRFERLRSLRLTDCPIADDGLAFVTVLVATQKDAYGLGLRNTKITDAGLARIAAATNIESLDLNGTAVTDAGILKLKDMKNLKSLSASDTKVTKAGVEALKKLLPDCFIYAD